MTLRTYITIEEEWIKDAQCQGTNPAIFFAGASLGRGKGRSIENIQATRLAKSICMQCEVREECLDYALRTNQDFGIWGGMTEKERKRLH